MELFDRLHDLHLTAGQPSIREITAGIGRGYVSSSTIHNVLRGPQVPRWSFLELIVKELGGDPDEFRQFWTAARTAEEQDAGENPAAPEAPVRIPAAPAPVQRRHWSSEIPPRNPDFVGRRTELAALRGNLIRDGNASGPLPQVIHGVGGVGKTEMATEYVHRHRSEYEIIWWIRAEHLDRVRDALVQLAQRLELSHALAGLDRDLAIASVLEELGTKQYLSWLLVFDNAVQPLDLQRYLPPRRLGGHVLITSRLRTWPGYIAESTELAPFTADEAVAFLRKKVLLLRSAAARPPTEDKRQEEEAGILAQTLCNLPIALDQASAYLAATGMAVEDYLQLLALNSRSQLSGDAVIGLQAVSSTVATSAAALTQDARMLLDLCAFFSPEPISMELFAEGAAAVTVPAGLGDVLSDPARFRHARNTLQRLSLAKVDGAHNLIQVHRVIQTVIREQLAAAGTAAGHDYTAAFQALLAASDPGNPDRSDNDPLYERSLPHIEPGAVLNTDIGALRDLVVNQVRRLHLRGGHVEALRLGQDALRLWQRGLSADDVNIQVLRLAVEVAIAMRLDGRAADARALTRDTLNTLLRYDKNHEVTLLCASSYSSDLRVLGQFQEALELDLDLLPRFERVFSRHHERTLNVLNDIAVDYRWLGDYEQARRYDERTFQGRKLTLGPDDIRTLSSRDAMARDLRRLGLHQESLELAREVDKKFSALGGRENLDRLKAKTGFAAALRKAGYHWDALRVSEEVVRRNRNFVTSTHSYALRAAANLICDRRLNGELAAAEELGREMLDYRQESNIHTSDITYADVTHATMVNLASVLRADGRPADAGALDLTAREGLTRLFGDSHPFTLAAAANYASDLAAMGDLAESLRIGRLTLEKYQWSMGPDHPDTLAAAGNLALDLLAADEPARAEALFADCAERYERTLPPEHPEARWAMERRRLSIDIEPDYH